MQLQYEQSDMHILALKVVMIKLISHFYILKLYHIRTYACPIHLVYKSAYDIHINFSQLQVIKFTI